MRIRYNQVAYLTRNTIWESDKSTRKHNTHKNQKVNLFPAGGHKAGQHIKTRLAFNKA